MCSFAPDRGKHGARPGERVAHGQAYRSEVVSAEEADEEESAVRHLWHGAVETVRRATDDGGEGTGLSAEHR
jgi:hypothetical protein